MLVGEVRCATMVVRVLLHVVGRQPVVVRADVRLEVSPRPARQLAQEMRLVGRQRIATAAESDG